MFLLNRLIGEEEDQVEEGEKRGKMMGKKTEGNSGEGIGKKKGRACTEAHPSER